MITATYSVPYRRKLTGKTDYRRRMRLLLGDKPRLTVRKSLKHIRIQIIEFQPKGDRVVLSANSGELAEYGWKASTSNTSAAYLTGLLIAKKANKKDCVLDIGQYSNTKGNVLYAAAKGAIDGGLKIALAKEVIPDEKRIRGEHIAEYAKMLKTKGKYEKQFGEYIKKGITPETLPQQFEQAKHKIEQFKHTAGGQ